MGRRPGRYSSRVEVRRDVVAEIKIEPKRRVNVMPWIVGVVLLVLVILAAASAAHRRGAGPLPQPGGGGGGARRTGGRRPQPPVRERRRRIRSGTTSPRSCASTPEAPACAGLPPPGTAGVLAGLPAPLFLAC